MVDKKALLKKANELPLSPGVYLMKDADGTVIYVGKAKVLKNRVTSYFRKGNHTAKTEKMVSLVDDFDVVLTATELDALLTECSLIKRFKPTYNLALKNKRGYQFICLTEKDGFPVLRLETFRSTKGWYWGPFLSRQKALLLVDLMTKAFSLPRCSQRARKKKVCLEYHLGRCPGYCEGKLGREELDALMQAVASVFDGRVDGLVEELTAKMLAASEELEFEKAADYRNRLSALQMIAEKQKTKTPPHRHADYIGYSSQDGVTAVFVLRVRNGYIVAEHCDVFREPFHDGLLREYMERFYADEEAPGKIYLDREYEWTPLINEWLRGAVSVPSFHQDADMLTVCHRNASERILQYLGRTKRGQRNLMLFCSFTGIEKASLMEIYDVSHMAGSDVVCGMVACSDGATDKTKYRRFKIGKYDGRDDTAYMSEAVFRRLNRYKEGDAKFAPLPDVIVCDGALAQIHAVEKVVASFGYPIRVIGFKKDRKHRTKSIVYADGREQSLQENPEVFSFCGRLQESVHKYAISYHRSLRDDSAARSELRQIEGLGKARVKALFDRFTTLRAIQNASVEELASVKGISTELAEKIFAALHLG